MSTAPAGPGGCPTTSGARSGRTRDGSREGIAGRPDPTAPTDPGPGEGREGEGADPGGAGCAVRVCDAPSRAAPPRRPGLGRPGAVGRSLPGRADVPPVRLVVRRSPGRRDGRGCGPVQSARQHPPRPLHLRRDGDGGGADRRRARRPGDHGGRGAAGTGLPVGHGRILPGTRGRTDRGIPYGVGSSPAVRDGLGHLPGLLFRGRAAGEAGGARRGASGAARDGAVARRPLARTGLLSELRGVAPCQMDTDGDTSSGTTISGEHL